MQILRGCFRPIQEVSTLHKTRIAMLGLGVALIACSLHAEAKNEGFGELTVDQVQDLIAKNDADIYDNNAKGDWAKGHVPTAKWVSFKDVKASDLPAAHARKLVFYCANPH